LRSVDHNTPDVKALARFPVGNGLGKAIEGLTRHAAEPTMITAVK
jgi:hypothetical protein